MSLHPAPRANEPNVSSKRWATRPSTCTPLARLAPKDTLEPSSCIAAVTRRGTERGRPRPTLKSEKLLWSLVSSRNDSPASSCAKTNRSTAPRHPTHTPALSPKRTKTKKKESATKSLPQGSSVAKIAEAAPPA
ncbi:hypothetical protein K458DRAFT_424297 [Lentithecium fluviatile CBS 122367]|uniref:Uncharacterized protein n=1 Tax=Lentithecium fluviatile CBS 122367 TaxID=1168545 RepID=A0A6G1IFX8_9PLEO|nr:hypothetical protein K458DRAFT_424297 [Lentithecium fluviatile CBS 122367]